MLPANFTLCALWRRYEERDIIDGSEARVNATHFLERVEPAGGIDDNAAFAAGRLVNFVL